MPFVLNEDQELIQKTVRELAQGPIAERATDADRNMAFPRANVPLLADLGLLGVLVPPEQGGAGADATTLAITCEELATGCTTTAAFTAVTNAWISTPLARYATDTVREEWLPRILEGKALGTFGLHEDAVGSDPFRIRTSARPADDEDGEGVTPGDASHEAGPAVLSGTKDLTFLVGAADLALVLARRGQDQLKRRVDMYAVPTTRDGVVWGSDESKMGLRGYPCGPLYLDKVALAPEDLMGAPGQGPDIARNAGQLLSIAIAAAAVGLGKAALHAAIQFANEREQFGGPIARFEAIQHNIADMRVAVDSTRNMVLHAAALFDRDGTAPAAAEEANIHAFELGRRLTRQAIRTHGGAGFMRELPVERFARDLRTLAAFGRNPDVSKSLVGMHNLKIESL